MALVLADRVQETTTTTGTGTVTLSGAVSGFQSFSAIGNGNTTYYTIADQTGTNWEVGLGTYTASGTTLSRDSVLSSSNSGSLVNFGAGTKNVFVTYPASKAVYNGGALGTPSSGTVTNLTGTASININGTVGATTPNTGAFTTLSASSTVSGSGFSTYLASPPAIGGTAAAAGSFTTLSASSTVSGTGFSTYLASPPAIGGTAAAAGSFTTLSASSTVSGTGFSTYLASPPAIGGTAAAAGTFTTLTANGNTTLGDATTDTITLTGTVQPGVVISGSSSGDALRITQTGAGNALLVEDAANPDSSPFVVDASGNVGIGTSSPGAKLAVSNGTQTGIINPRSSASGGLAIGTDIASAGHVLNLAGDLNNGGTGGGVNISYYSSASSTWNAALSIRNTASAYSNLLLMQDGGNVGIGVTPSNALDVQKAGTAAATTDFLELTNSGNAASMTNTGTGILFNQFYYDATTPAVADAGRIAVKTEGNWTSTASTQDAYMTFETALDGTVAERVRIGSGGEVYFPGVGTTASAANAYLNNGSTPANQLLRSTSSLRYKTDVETLDHAKADAVLNLRPVWYRSKAEADRKDWSWYGLIAEEVAQVEPRLVHWSYPEDQFETIETQTDIEKTREVEVTPAVLDDEGNVVEPAVTETETYTETETKSERKLKADAQLAPDGVQYDRLTVMLLDIVKRQNQRIEQLEAKVAALETQ